MDRRLFLLPLLIATSCGRGDAPASQAAASGTSRDSSAGSIAAATDASGGGSATRASAPANPQGRIPVLEYHVIGGDKNALYTRTAASYRNDLETAYKLGYRPITVSQMLDKDFRDVPAGMSPVVVVFDDASDSQFRYLEKDGKLVVDPTSALGIWEDVAKSHPGWKSRGVFCMLNGAAAGHNFFGD